jgi:hypothetical protein
MMLDEGNEKDLGLNGIDMISTALDELKHMDGYVDIIYFLKNFSSLDHLTDHRRRGLRLEAVKCYPPLSRITRRLCLEAHRS